MWLCAELLGTVAEFFALVIACRMLERHLELYLKAVAAAAQNVTSAELQRECRALQEQLVLLVATATREAPEILLSFAAASALPSGSDNRDCCKVSGTSNGMVEQCLSTSSFNNVDFYSSGATITHRALLQLLHQEQQHLHLLLYGSLHSSRAASAVTSRTPQGVPPSQEIAGVTWKCILLLLLHCCFPGGCPVVAAAATQSWGQLAAAFLFKPEPRGESSEQQRLELLKLPPDLQGIQEVLCEFAKKGAAFETQRQRRQQGGSSQALHKTEDTQLLRQERSHRLQSLNQQQAGQQFSLMLPLPSIFKITARLFASLKTDEPQHIKVSPCCCI